MNRSTHLPQKPVAELTCSFFDTQPMSTSKPLGIDGGYMAWEIVVLRQCTDECFVTICLAVPQLVVDMRKVKPIAVLVGQDVENIGKGYRINSATNSDKDCCAWFNTKFVDKRAFNAFDEWNALVGDLWHVHQVPNDERAARTLVLCGRGCLR
jgi:hypothetical protein